MRIEVYQKDRLLQAGDFTGTVELGRRCQGETEPFRREIGPGHWRAIVAKLTEDAVSRKHALLEPLADRRLRLTNLSQKVAIGLPGAVGDLSPGQSRELSLPLVLTLGDKNIHVRDAELAADLMQSLAEILPPGRSADPGAWTVTRTGPPEAGLDVEAVIRWLQAAMNILHRSANATDFFDTAARALVERLGLDTGWVLLYQQGAWKVETVHRADPNPSPGASPSQRLLGRVRREKRTFWTAPDQQDGSASLVDVQAVVVAPILDPAGEVIGALYGDRRLGGRPGGLPRITRLEALLVELLASGVATGLARLAQERAVLALRIQFEQFFTPQLAKQLAVQPDLLQGQDAEVSVLFCDLRRFSRHCERLGPARTVEWLHDVWGELSECVRHREGVLVDYIADELIAMWGAPEKNPDHPWLACQAALEMVQRLADLDRRWQDALGEPLALGIGINTGVARVGNTGSRFKFKYGPLGGAVNLASRVQGATKYLKRPLLITAGTWQRVRERVSARRLGTVRVLNIAEPVDLYELVAAESPGWAEFQHLYEQGLAAFERQDHRTATATLGRLLAEYPADGPTLVLLGRITQALLKPAEHFDPVWELPDK